MSKRAGKNFLAWLSTRLAAVVVGAAVVGVVALAVRPDPATVAVTDEESPLSVACSPNGITLSGTTVAATSAGVAITVSSTMPAGSYLNFMWPGGGGGDPLPAAKTTWTLLTPPGQLNLSCTLNGDAKPAAAQTVTVTDPDKVWRSTTPAELGCPKGGIIDWGRRPGSGSSAEAAVQDLLPRLTTDGRPLTGTRAPIGYPDAAEQTWIAYFADGTAHTVIDVSPSSSGFTAGPDILCSK